MFNVRGCKQVMYDWYRSGFTMNILMALVGVLISAFKFVSYTYNRKEYFNLLYELDDMTKPMMNTMSMSTIISRSSGPYGYGIGINGSIRGGPSSGSMRSNNTFLQANRQLPQLPHPNSISSYGYHKGSIYEQANSIKQ
jgi:hypothetical protein